MAEESKSWWENWFGGDSKDGDFDFKNILSSAIGPGLKGLSDYLVAKESTEQAKRISPLEQMKFDLEKQKFDFAKEQAKEGTALDRAKLEFESARTKELLLQRAMEMQAAAIRAGSMNQAATLQNVIENIRGPLMGVGGMRR
jgi:hypothetical protein